jgi:hypothetical protein
MPGEGANDPIGGGRQSTTSGRGRGRARGMRGITGGRLDHWFGL